MFKSILSGFIRPFLLGEVRHLATFASGAIAVWLIGHGASQSDAADIGEGVSSIIVGLAGYGFSVWLDRKRPQTAVALPSGKVVVLGKPSNVSPADEAAETAALNEQQAAK